jgi:signal transduction histidine kinase
MHDSPAEQGEENDIKGMSLDWVTLRFTGPSAVLEKNFYQNYASRTLQNLRIALVLGFLMYGIFGVLDALMMPEQKYIPWMIRYLVVCPALVIMLGITYFPYLQRYLQPLMSFIFALGGLGIVVMIAVAPQPINYLYYAGLILVFIFGYTFVFLRFLWASLSGWIIVISYEVFAFVTDTPATILISNSFFLVSANMAGMIACYNIEYSNRRNYFLTQLLDREQRKIRETNEQLERRVAERTETLEKMNRQLIQEIQDRQRLETQLKRAEKMETIGNLAAGVAHDLNNILVGLVSYPDMILYKLSTYDPLREDIVRIQKSGERASAMVQDLLALARRGATEKQVINLNTTVREYMQSPEFQRLANDHPRVGIETDLETDLLNIHAAPTQMNKALMNLVTNAAEATLNGGTVLIATTNCYIEEEYHGLETIPSGEYAVLSVRDKGIGISREDQQKIFEPFYSKKRMGRSGTGLGMTVVWNTTKDLGGFVDIKSAEGQGTVIDLYLPSTREDLPTTPERIFIDDLRGTERVLVVDDVSEQREIASGILSRLGYNVATAGSGEEAVAWLSRNEIDIAVLDMIMYPGIDGCETYRNMIAVKPRLKAIIVSGFSESDRVKEAQRLGAGAYVKKPYTMERIALAVRNELNRKA